MMRLLIAAFLVLSQPLAARDTLRPYDSGVDVRRLETVLRSGSQADLSRRVDRSIAQMVALASHKLRQKGFKKEALAVEADYERRYAGLVSSMVMARAEGRLGDLGDWAPMSEWLVKLHDRLLGLLGPEIMAFTHLEDIKVVNFGVPVVFNFEAVPDQLISPTEYKKHFVPLSGVTAYWGVSISCSVGTWGTGYWVICSPAGLLAKYAVVNYVAPPWSPRWYGFFYPRDDQ